MTTFTYDNPDGKGTNSVTYVQNKDGSWTVVSNHYYNCSGSSYGSSSTGSGSGACGDYSSSTTKSGTGSTGKTNGGNSTPDSTPNGTGTCGGTSTGGTGTGNSGSDGTNQTEGSGTGGTTTGDNPGGDDENSGLIDNNSTQPQNEYEHLVCSNLNDVHCDIIAWNHAVDAGLNPMGENGTDWDANNNTVNQIFNEHFQGQDVAFDGNQAGQMGYILYDWEGDGIYDHIEFGSISEDGLSYSFYNNDGYDTNGHEHYYTRTFAEDSNAGARQNSPGTIRFIPLN